MAENNQKRVMAIKETVNGNKKPYIRLNQDSMFTAMQNLGANAFKLYLYIIKNQDKWEFELSSKHACQLCSFSLSTYNRAVDELKTKGYLKKIGTSGNRWACYELPEEVKEKAAGLDVEPHEFQF